MVKNVLYTLNQLAHAVLVAWTHVVAQTKKRVQLRGVPDQMNALRKQIGQFHEERAFATLALDFEY